jgi:outer membrane protein OmpA-like peptidoglycan-associated protein
MKKIIAILAIFMMFEPAFVEAKQASNSKNKTYKTSKKSMAKSKKQSKVAKVNNKNKVASRNINTATTLTAPVAASTGGVLGYINQDKPTPAEALKDNASETEISTDTANTSSFFDNFASIFSSEKQDEKVDVKQQATIGQGDNEAQTLGFLGKKKSEVAEVQEQKSSSFMDSITDIFNAKPSAKVTAAQNTKSQKPADTEFKIASAAPVDGLMVKKFDGSAVSSGSSHCLAMNVCPSDSLSFAKDEIELNDDAKAMVAKYAQKLKDRSDIYLKVVSVAMNNEEKLNIGRKVAMQRALRIRNYLIEQGIDEAKISIVTKQSHEDVVYFYVIDPKLEPKQ